MQVKAWQGKAVFLSPVGEGDHDSEAVQPVLTVEVVQVEGDLG